jgi:hypothetical protein
MTYFLGDRRFFFELWNLIFREDFSDTNSERLSSRGIKVISRKKKALDTFKIDDKQ